MRVRQPGQKRKGSVLVEYALLVAGITLVSVVAVALLGDKVRDSIGIIAAVLPSAHTEDNKPIEEGSVVPLDHEGDSIKLNASGMVSAAGVDRFEAVLGPKGGEALIVD